MAASWGTGFISIPPAPPIGVDYSYNWININHGTAIIPTPTSLKGGPGGWYMDFAGTATEPPPTGSTSKIWDGAVWQSADSAKVWNGTAWQNLAGQKVWSGTGWVAI